MARDSKKVGRIPSLERTLRVKRFNPESGIMEEREYKMSMPVYATVLDALLDIKDGEDATLSFRYSCRMGICGSCGMVIDGRPSLACQAHLSDLGEEITVAPMLGQPVLRDLANDFDDFFEKHKSIEPWMEERGDEKFDRRSESVQSRENVEDMLPFASCIKCGLCLDACPVVNSNPEFVGPQALAQEQKLILDSRDKEKDRRLELVDTKNGIWGCEFIGACSDVCPKGVDPALAIQEMKIEAMKKQVLGLRSHKKRDARR